MIASLRRAVHRRWRGYWRLPPADRRVVLRSWALLGMAALLLKFLRLQTVVHLVARLTPLPIQGTGVTDLGRAEDLAARFVTVANLHALPMTCLPRAVGLWWLLRRSGIDADIILGVQPRPGAVAAHAWVETGGQVLGDPTQVYLAYSTILTRYPKRP